MAGEMETKTNGRAYAERDKPAPEPSQETLARLLDHKANEGLPIGEGNVCLNGHRRIAMEIPGVTELADQFLV